MIKEILDLLKLDKWHGESETIDIAKGKYKHTLDLGELFEQKKREFALRKKIKHG